MRVLLVLALTGCYAAHERPPMCTDEAAPSDLPHYGEVAVVGATSGTTESWQVTGGFGDETLAQHDANEIAGSDVGMRVGDCVLLGARAAPSIPEDGGDITASDAGRVLTVAHYANAYEDTGGVGAIPITDGDVVAITTSGGVVPPFAACVTLPAAMDGAVLPTRWPAGGPLVATWNPMLHADTAELQIGVVTGGRIRLIECRVPASTGRVEVAESLRGTVIDRSQITLLIEQTHIVPAGDYAVRAIGARAHTGTLTLE